MRNIQLWLSLVLIGIIIVFYWLLSGDNMQKVLIRKDGVKPSVMPTSHPTTVMPSPMATPKPFSSYTLTETYTNKDLGITIPYPKGWSVREGKELNGKINSVTISGVEGDLGYVVNPDGGGFDRGYIKLPSM